MNSMFRVHESRNRQLGNVVWNVRRCMAAVAVLVSFMGMGQTVVAQGASSLIYQGNVTTNVALFDFYGQAKGVFSFQNALQVSLASPLNAGGLQETNPFRFIIESISVAGGPPPGSPGQISLASAANVNGVMLQYWQFGASSDTNWQGSLTDSHVREAAAANLLIVPRPSGPHTDTPAPLAMAEGAQMRITANESQFTMILDGVCTDGFTSFHIEIVTQRVQ